MYEIFLNNRLIIVGEIVAAENVLNKGCAEFPNSFSIIQLKMKFITNQCALKSDFSRFEEEVAKFETFVYSKIPQSSCLLEELVDFYLQIPLFAEVLIFFIIFFYLRTKKMLEEKLYKFFKKF